MDLSELLRKKRPKLHEFHGVSEFETRRDTPLAVGRCRRPAEVLELFRGSVSRSDPRRNPFRFESAPRWGSESFAGIPRHRPVVTPWVSSASSGYVRFVPRSSFLQKRSRRRSIAYRPIALLRLPR